MRARLIEDRTGTLLNPGAIPRFQPEGASVPNLAMTFRECQGDIFADSASFLFPAFEGSWRWNLPQTGTNGSEYGLLVRIAVGDTIRELGLIHFRFASGGSDTGGDLSELVAASQVGFIAVERDHRFHLLPVNVSDTVRGDGRLRISFTDPTLLRWMRRSRPAWLACIVTLPTMRDSIPFVPRYR